MSGFTKARQCWKIALRGTPKRITHIWPERAFDRDKKRVSGKAYVVKSYSPNATLPVRYRRVKLHQVRRMRPATKLVREIRAALAQEHFFQRGG